MDRKSPSLQNDNFKAFIVALLNQNDPEGYRPIGEFQKLFHSKKLKIMAAESNGVRSWSDSLQSR